jgi:hypothetical protein
MSKIKRLHKADVLGEYPIYEQNTLYHYHFLFWDVLCSYFSSEDIPSRRSDYSLNTSNQ